MASPVPIDLAAIMEARSQRAGVGRRRRRRPRRRKTMRPVKPRLVDELEYRRDLLALVNLMTAKTTEILFPELDRLEPQYLRDNFPDDLTDAIAGLKGQLGDLDRYAQARAEAFVGGVDKAHGVRFFNEMKRATGVDMQGIINTERLDVVLQASVSENVALITSIPQQYHQRLTQMVFTNTVGGSTAGSLKDQIMELYDVTESRAKFIARDQTASLNSAINTERNVAAGIKQYIWKTSRDERVRTTHRARDKKVFTYGTREGQEGHPGETGHPGEDFQCRCVSRSIVPDFPVPANEGPFIPTAN